MNLQISGKNFELSTAIHTYAQDKIGSIERFHDNIIETHVTVEKIHEHHDTMFHVVARCHVSHDELYCEATNVDVYAAIDEAKDELIRQIRDLKARYETKHRKAQASQRELKSIV